MTSETAFKNKVKKWFSQNNIYHIPYPASMYSKVGIPDSLIIINGYHIWIEFKTDNGKLSKIQETRIEELQNNGAEVWVLKPSNFEEFKERLEANKYD